jgi:hypothetical protein
VPGAPLKDPVMLCGSTVFGAGGGRAKNFELWKPAMGIDWMTKREIAEAIPPAYTEWIGWQLRFMLARKAIERPVSHIQEVLAA